MKRLLFFIIILSFCSYAEASTDKRKYHHSDPQYITDSIKNEITQELRPYVYQRNDQGSWDNIKRAAEHYLKDQWSAGHLKGTRYTDSYDVQVGLGSTMTDQDIKDGHIKVTVKVALNAPGDYTTLTFTQEVAK